MSQYLRGEVTPSVELFTPEVFSSFSEDAEFSAPVWPAARDMVAQILGGEADAPRRVLELNAGLGVMTPLVRPLFAECEYTVADPSPFLLSLCERRLEGLPGVQYRVTDATELPCAEERERYDVVVCFTPWYLADSPAELLLAAARRLAVGGVLILSLPTGQTPWVDLRFALSQIGLRPTGMALSSEHRIDGPWNNWCSAGGFSRPIVFEPCTGTVLKSLLITQLQRPPAWEPSRRPDASAEQSLNFWRAFWASCDSEYEALLFDRLRTQLSSVLNHCNAQQIDPHSQVSQLGLDSLMMLELQRRTDPAQRWMSPPWEVWGNRSLQELSAHWAAAARACMALVSPQMTLRVPQSRTSLAD